MKEKLNFLQTFIPHLMAWEVMPELFSVLEIQSSRISKVEAVY